MKSILLFLCCWVVIASPLAVAGDPDYQDFSYKSPSYSESESIREDTGDLSSLESKKLTDGFRISAGLRSLSLTDAAVQGSNSEGGFLVIPSLELGYKAPLAGGFGLDGLVSLDSFTNVGRGSRSFWGPSANLKLDYRYNDNLPRIWVGIEPYWYGNYDGDRIAEAIGFAAGTDYGLPFNRGRSLFTIGYSFVTYLASPSQDDRNAHRAVVALSHQFASDLFGQLFYQFQHSDYTNEDGTDLRNIIGGSVTYRFTQQFYTSLSLSFVNNNSTRPLADYEALALGFGVGFEF